MRITERTFGLEIEFANVEKSKVKLPTGFEWSEAEVVHNTDGSRGTFGSKYGGEINTPPLYLTMKSKELIKSLYADLLNAGAKNTRELSLQTHIYIGDLELEQVKKIFYLTYYTSRFIDEVSYIPDYSKFTIFTPSPTLEDYVKVQNAMTFDHLRAVFENSTAKGFVRHIVNISSYFKRKTVEFRNFCGTTDTEKVYQCLLFSYRFIQFALDHSEEDFKAIESTEQFKKLLKITYTLPPQEAPMIFYGNPLDIKESLRAKKLDLNTQLMKIFLESTSDKVATVNPIFYSLELKCYKQKKLTIYNNDEFNHIIYLVATGKVKIAYNGKMSFLQECNSDDPRYQLACVLIFYKLRKYIYKDLEFSNTLLKSYIDSIDKTVQKSMPMCEALIDMFSKSDYRLGTVNDAISEGGCVFFQFDEYASSRNTAFSLKKYSDYKEPFTTRKTEYYHLVENLPANVDFKMASRNPNLNLLKCGRVGGVTFYSSTGLKQNKIKATSKKQKGYSFTIPPDDLDVCDATKLKIVKVDSAIFKASQMEFVVKVHKFSKAIRYCYFVMYEEYLLGGFGFDMPRDEEYDVWLLSDYCTNNKIARLSKLILLCVQSEQIRNSISRKRMAEITTCYTKVYSKENVSMKYRPIFKKVAKLENHLLYVTNLGVSGSIENIITKYQEFKTKAK